MDEGLGEVDRSCNKLGDGCSPLVEPSGGGWEGGDWGGGGMVLEGGVWVGEGVVWEGGVWDGGGVAWKGSVWDGGCVASEGVDVCRSSITASTRSSRCAR